MEQEQEHATSTRPYFIRAIYEWCTDNGFTPYLAVNVDENVQVPIEYIKNGEIVLNLSFTATANLELGNDYIRFQARFAGSARQLIVPVENVIAIYARENGQGMAFPIQGHNGASEASSQTQNKGSPLHFVDDTPPKKNQSEGESSIQGGEGKSKKNKPEKPTFRIVE